MPADADLVEALRAGDPDAFRTVVSDYNPGLVRMASTYVPAALAEEVVQDTWAAVVRAIDTFEGRSSLKTWIYRIMLNKVRTLATREAKIVPFAALGHTGSDDEASVDPDRLRRPGKPGHWSEPPTRWHELPAEHLEAEETLREILAAIEQLPPAQREVVELRDVQGWSPEEICNTLGISSVNQRVLLHRGRTALRRMLEQRFSSDDIT